MMTSLSRMGIVLKEEHMLADVSDMMSSELRRHCNHYFIFISCLRDVFPPLPVQPITEFKCTDTLNSYPFLITDGICHKTQSQTNRHPSINCHRRRGKPLPPSIILLSTWAITPSAHYFPVIDCRCVNAVPNSYP